MAVNVATLCAALSGYEAGCRPGKDIGMRLALLAHELTISIHLLC